jgi:hemerythrin-like domain-containing protein
MLAEHAAIRRRIEDVRRRLEASAPLEASLSELGLALHNHVRLEENEVFPRIEAVLGEDELRRLHLSRLHSASKTHRKRTLKTKKKKR